MDKMRLYRKWNCNSPMDRNGKKPDYFIGKVKIPRFIGKWLWENDFL